MSGERLYKTCLCGQVSDERYSGYNQYSVCNKGQNQHTKLLLSGDKVLVILRNVAIK